MQKNVQKYKIIFLLENLPEKWKVDPTSQSPTRQFAQDALSIPYIRPVSGSKSWNPQHSCVTLISQKSKKTDVKEVRHVSLARRTMHTAAVCSWTAEYFNLVKLKEGPVILAHILYCKKTEALTVINTACMSSEPSVWFLWHVICTSHR
jgi:hypothetical protein